jgi:hypothetical protein
MECGDSQVHRKQKVNLRRWVNLIEFITSLANLHITGSLEKKEVFLEFELYALAIIRVDQFFQSSYTSKNSEDRVVRASKMEPLNKQCC